MTNPMLTLEELEQQKAKKAKDEKKLTWYQDIATDVFILMVVFSVAKLSGFYSKDNSGISYFVQTLVVLATAPASRSAKPLAPRHPKIQIKEDWSTRSPWLATTQSNAQPLSAGPWVRFVRYQVSNVATNPIKPTIPVAADGRNGPHFDCWDWR